MDRAYFDRIFVEEIGKIEQATHGKTRKVYLEKARRLFGSLSTAATCAEFLTPEAYGMLQ